MKPGSYKVTARVVVQHRTASPSLYEVGLTVGLLTAAPSAEGGDVQEIDDVEYKRQPGGFRNASESGMSRQLRSAAAVSFGPVSNWPSATHVGLFDQTGALVAYGPLVTSPGHAEAGEVVFAASAVEILFK